MEKVTPLCNASGMSGTPAVTSCAYGTNGTPAIATSTGFVDSCGELASPIMEEGASSPPGGYTTGSDPFRTGKQLWADTVDTDHDERIVPICDWQTKEKLITLNLMLMAVKGQTSELAVTKTAEIQQEIKRIHLTYGMPAA